MYACAPHRLHSYDPICSCYRRHLSQRHLEEAYIEVWGGHAIRLLRLELKLIQRLDKHRHSNKQKVRVEHVHIHAGAQGVSGISNSSKERDNEDAKWPAPGSEDTELGVLMEPEVSHGETEVYAGVQA